MTAEKKNGLGSGFIEIDGETYGTKTFEYDGERFVVRELSPDDGDETLEAATGPDGKVNAGLQTKMLLSRALVEPKYAVDRMGKIANRKYLTILREFNQLNSIDLANPTPQGGSPVPESPVGGAQPQQP